MALPKLFGGSKMRKARREKETAPKSRVALPELFHNAPQQSGSSQLPGFSVSAADLPNRRNDRFSAMRMKVRNAFTPSQPVFDRRLFAGRTDMLKSAIRSIEDQRLHLVIYGERGIGKTSLLHMLAAAAREARYIVVYSSCGGDSTFDETFRAAAADIPILFHSDFAPTTYEAERGTTLASLLPDRELLPRQFGDMCTKLTGTRVLIFLDEFDRVVNPKFRRDLAELIKILSDRSVRVQLVIAGVAADLAELVEHVPSVRRNILAIPVPLMTPEEVNDLVGLGERASGIVVTPAARERIVTISAGSPYTASLLSHHAALDAMDDERSEVLTSDVAAALEQALAELQGRISKHTMAQVHRLIQDSSSELLGLIASASLVGDGEFDLHLLESKAGGGSKATRCKTIVSELTSRQILLHERDDGFGRRFAFIEDAVPLYLWFLSQRDAFESEGGKAQRASAH